MTERVDEMNVTIRRATRVDIPDIVRLLADDPLGQHRESYSDPLPEIYFSAFERIDADPRNELMIAEVNGRVVGTLQLTLLPYLTYQGGTRAQIEAVRVDEAYRSRGLGRHLIEWAIERARQLGCHMVQLTTNAARPDALRFYERLGFVASHVGMKLELTNSSTADTEPMV